MRRSPSRQRFAARARRRISASSPPKPSALLSVWHDAFEWSYYEPLLGALAAPHPRRPPARAGAAWALFCLDNRSSSLRRHLEEVTPRVATFGTAGFFGLDFVYCGAGDAIASKHCPDTDPAARHLVVESYEEGSARRRSRPWWRRPTHLEAAVEHASPRLAPLVRARPRRGGAARCERLPPVAGAGEGSAAQHGQRRRALQAGPRGRRALARRIMARLHHRGARRSRAGALRSIGAAPSGPSLSCFSATARAASTTLLRRVQLRRLLGPLGRAERARFRQSRQSPRRARRAARPRIDIPESTWFVGALYDTTRDEPTYYDLHRMPDRFAPRWRISPRDGPGGGAQRRRALPPLRDVAARSVAGAALAEVRQRSVSLFEPRPEYNHATNAACVVGRRALTEDLFLDRRVFLSSYDPEPRPDGATLASVLAAVVPVCAGINLEYFFSRLDPIRYGAGTKLPHNVNGLLGVCNGIEGDLLTGLPTQMTEIHDPVRLLTVVEQNARDRARGRAKQPGRLRADRKRVGPLCLHRPRIAAGVGVPRRADAPARRAPAPDRALCERARRRAAGPRSVADQLPRPREGGDAAMIEIALVATIALPLVIALVFTVGADPGASAPQRAWRCSARPSRRRRRGSRSRSGSAHRARPFRGAPHVLFHHGNYEFVFGLLLDGAAAVFLALIQFITGLVIRFSRFYLHREPGFRRFFATVLFFQAAMCLLALAGNLDLMFAGWEMVGLSSFLLIGFYRERQSAVRNALKTYSVYRIADIGMLLAACLEVGGDRLTASACSCCSPRWASRPSSRSASGCRARWRVPPRRARSSTARCRCMPAPTSASHVPSVGRRHGGPRLHRRDRRRHRGAVFDVQPRPPTIKGQIGYASVTQVGVIFVEIALGLTHLALLTSFRTRSCAATNC